jgi:acyl-CoA dehydrogenase
MGLSSTDTLLTDAVSKLLANISTNKLCLAVEEGYWPSSQWAQVVEMGLPMAWLPENLGGIEMPLEEGFTIARLAGRYATPLPIADALIASAIATRAKLKLPDALVLFANTPADETLVINSDDTISGRCSVTTFAGNAQYLLLPVETLTGSQFALIKNSGSQSAVETTMAGEPRCECVFEKAKLLALSDEGFSDIQKTIDDIGAVVRSQQIAGAAEAVLAMCVNYVNVREQFGRPIAKFQAIQHHLAALAGEVASIACSADVASLSLIRNNFNSSGLDIAIASAKVRAGTSGAEVIRIAHQVHGAIGFTEEYDLHRFTKRIWSWREEFGNEMVWARRLGQRVTNSESPQLWPLVCI